jgi:transcriptional regulator with XRE-family HTH domain
VEPDELKEARKALRLTQKELAVELGVHAVTVARWETGARGIPEPVAKLVRRLTAERRSKKPKR